MKVLMIDGPMKGQVHDEPGDYRAVRCLDYGAVSGLLHEDIPVRTYHVHKLVLFDRVLLVGSLEYLPGDALAKGAFWELLASDTAREVALPAHPAAEAASSDH